MKIIKLLCYLFLCLFISFDNQSDIVINNNIESNNVFIIDIPKINLTKQVFPFYDKNNNVNKGIYLAKDYDFMTLKGTLILASHSGNSPISYFKNLDLLNSGDVIKIIHNSFEYYYIIIDIYKIDKNGKFQYSNENKTICLVTCDKKNKHKQVVYKGKLVKITKKSTFF